MGRSLGSLVAGILRMPTQVFEDVHACPMQAQALATAASGFYLRIEMLDDSYGAAFLSTLGYLIQNGYNLITWAPTQSWSSFGPVFV